MNDTIDYIMDKLGKMDLAIHYLQESANNDQIVVYFKLLSDTAKQPTKSFEAAGWDLYADEDAEVFYNIPTLVKTNISFQPPPGYHGFIWDRSSMGKKGVKVFGGVIDSDYRGPIGVVLNLLDRQILQPYKIKKGDRIAQIVFTKLPTTYLVESDELSETERSDKAFGSSGK